MNIEKSKKNNILKVDSFYHLVFNTSSYKEHIQFQAILGTSWLSELKAGN